MTQLILTHSEDPDGIIAHALLIRALGIKEINPENHFFARYDRLADDFGKLERRVQDVPKSSVYIADIGLNGQLAAAGGRPYACLEGIALAAEEKFWVDHHETTLKHGEALSRMGFQLHYNSERCAALLIRDIFGLQGEYESELAQIAQAHDHKKPGSASERVVKGNEIEKVIALANERLDYSTMHKLTLGLAQGKAVDHDFNLQGEWRDHVVEFDTRTVAAYRELESSIVVEEVAGLRVLFAHSPAILSQKPALEYLQTNHSRASDMYVCFFRPPVRNHIILRKQGSNFPAVELCGSLGGGGRGNGGGFSTVEDVDAARISMYTAMISAKIVEYQSRCA